MAHEIAPHNPRKTFDEGQPAELAESIRTLGLLQPIVVRRIPNLRARAGLPQFEIGATDRHWWAAQRAGLERVSVRLATTWTTRRPGGSPL